MELCLCKDEELTVISVAHSESEEHCKEKLCGNEQRNVEAEYKKKIVLG